MGKSKRKEKKEKLSKELARLVRKEMKKATRRPRKRSPSSSSSDSSSSSSSSSSSYGPRKKRAIQSVSSSSDSERNSDELRRSEETVNASSKVEGDLTLSRDKASDSTNMDAQDTHAASPVKESTADNNKSSNDETVSSEKELRNDVLDRIGKRLVEDRPLAEPVHSAFHARWQDVFKLGLPKEERAELVKKFPLPKNCTFLDAPKLNKEIVLSVGESCKTRDARIVEKHNRLLACLGANSAVLMDLLSRDNDADLTAIEAISNAARLIIDTLHEETCMRRALIVGNVNTSMRDVLSATEPDEFLFGGNLPELLKQAQATNKDVQVLAKKPSPLVNRSKNFKRPQRQQSRSQTTSSSGPQTRSATTTSKQQESRHKGDHQKARYDQNKSSKKYYQKK